MSKNRLFNQTKISLTCWYASIFSGIIRLGALGVYEAIVLNHGGKITLESEENKGSIFTIYLPKIISS